MAAGQTGTVELVPVRKSLSPCHGLCLYFRTANCGWGDTKFLDSFSDDRALGRTLDLFRIASQAGGICRERQAASGQGHHGQAGCSCQGGFHGSRPGQHGWQGRGPLAGTGTALRPGTGSGWQVLIALPCQPGPGGSRVLQRIASQHSAVGRLRGLTAVTSRRPRQVITAGGPGCSPTGDKTHHDRGAAGEPYPSERSGGLRLLGFQGAAVHGGSRLQQKELLILDSEQKDQHGGDGWPG